MMLNSLHNAKLISLGGRAVYIPTINPVFLLQQRSDRRVSDTYGQPQERHIRLTFLLYSTLLPSSDTALP